MLSLYDLLKTRKTGIAPDLWTALAAKNCSGDSGAEVKELTGIPPLSIRSNGTMLLDYHINGNMVQTGTPTPQNPIQPQECGERTDNIANLYGVDKTSLSLNLKTGDNMTIVINGTKTAGANVISVAYPNITLPAGTYTVRIKMIGGTISNITGGAIFGINASTYAMRTAPQVSKVGDIGIRTFTLTEDTLLSSLDITPSYGDVGSVWDNATFECWLYSGSDDIPYEPYGYKIPISSGGENLVESYIARCNINATGTLIGNPDFNMFVAKISQGQTYSLDTELIGGFFTSKPSIGSVSYNNNRDTSGGRTFVAPIDGYVAFRKASTETTAMLNRGSTPLPYEPYNRTTPPVYLGEVPTTRDIKKLVLTGDESWNKNIADASDTLYWIRASGTAQSRCVISHLQFSASIPTRTTIGFAIRSANNVLYFNFGADVMNAQSSGNTVAGLKEYLAAQYAARTPVTVWYVLAEPETSIVNEPLRKIGDYADTISMEQAQVQIPTNRGLTTIDVATTLKPSQAYIKYRG